MQFLVRYGWQIAAGFVLLELLAVGVTLFALGRRSRHNRPATDRTRLWWLGAPLLLDLTVLAAVGIAAFSAVIRIVLLIRSSGHRRLEAVPLEPPQVPAVGTAERS